MKHVLGNQQNMIIRYNIDQPPPYLCWAHLAYLLRLVQSQNSIRGSIILKNAKVGIYLNIYVSLIGQQHL